MLLEEGELVLQEVTLLLPLGLLALELRCSGGVSFLLFKLALEVLLQDLKRIAVFFFFEFERDLGLLQLTL